MSKYQKPEVMLLYQRYRGHKEIARRVGRFSAHVVWGMSNELSSESRLTNNS